MKTIDAEEQKILLKKNEYESKSHKTFSTRLLLDELVLTGVFVGLFALMRFVFKDIRIINGYDIQMQFIILALGLFTLRTYYFRIVYLIMAPFITLAFGAQFWLLNQLMPSLSFFLFIFLEPIANKCWSKKKSKKGTALVLTAVLFMNLISYMLVHFWYTLSGVIDYNVSWGYSFWFNAPIAYATFGISVAAMFMSVYPIWLLRGKFDPNIYYSIYC